jgi:hypothetical protein
MLPSYPGGGQGGNRTVYRSTSDTSEGEGDDQRGRTDSPGGWYRASVAGSPDARTHFLAAPGSGRLRLSPAGGGGGDVA